MDFSRGSKMKDGIRIAAGAYLIYLAIEVLRDGVFGGGMTGAGYYAGWAAGIVFLVAGAAVIIYSVKSLLSDYEESKKELIEEKQNTDPDESVESASKDGFDDTEMAVADSEAESVVTEASASADTEGE